MSTAPTPSKPYSPQEVEDNIYSAWKKSGYFNPDTCVKDGICPHDAKVFSLLMPPPNVTGVLHLGHALENTIMDTAVRFHRMKGERTLYLPGTDHAAVATQARVERNLIESGEYKNPREELGREKLLEIVRKYAEESKSTIIHQVAKLGSSCDWSRLAYTFDEPRSKAVNAIFKKMYDDGLIYHGYRAINWSVQGQSTCSDDELEYIERDATLYTFKYSKDFPFSISTTRPETKLGDTAVAVNPKDERYKKYIGQTFTVDVGSASPLEIKIIADNGVEPEFGTGALGVTPAHSQIDYDIYVRQKAAGDPIGLIAVIDRYGKMTPAAGKNYEGLTVEEARIKFVEYLRQNNLLKKEEPTKQNVGTSDRFKDPVEVIPMEQWFVDVNKIIPDRNKSLKDLMREAVTVGHNNKPEETVKIISQKFHDSYLHWIEHLRDWCISRQIWWGHRIPVWTRGEETYVGEIAPDGDGWVQDSDTLDTWFSSGLWTFSTLGWPNETADLKNYHPNSWMQMAYDIQFFWMARMILMTTYALDTIPFMNVYIHGLLRDKNGKKFSKSLRNATDPLLISDEFGTDALRLALIDGVTPGNDSRFYTDKVAASRNMVNKLWNISRFILGQENIKTATSLPTELTLADKFILSRYNKIIEAVTDDLEKWNFSAMEEKLRAFLWSDLADWYLEISKVESNKSAILRHLLIGTLKLYHPIIPFVTEHIWSGFMNKTNNKKELLMISAWPKVDKKYIDDTAEVEFGGLVEIITAIRNLRATNKIEPAQKLNSTIIPSQNHADLINQNITLIKFFGRLENLTIANATPGNEQLKTMVGGTEIYLEITAADTEKQAERQAKEIARLKDIISRQEAKLANQEFVANAPEAVVTLEKNKLAQAKEQLEKLM